MRLVLVKPGLGEVVDGYRLNEGRMEPLQLGILAALTPPDVEVSLYDDRMEAIPFDRPADLAAVTVDGITARRAYAISAEFRRRGVPVVLGGIHASLAPDEAALHADAVVVGDAEPVWASVIADARAGRLRPRYGGPFGEPQQGVLPRRDIFAGKGYLPVSLVQFSRGCPYHCTFCAVARYFRSEHHCRRVSEVVREIEEGGLRLVLFTDDNLTANRPAAAALCRALKPLGIRWASQVSVDVAQDPELLTLMAESGCIGQLVGFDAIDPDALRWMRKTPNLMEHDRYAHAVETLREHGFQVWASFMLGNDHDTEAGIRETVRFAIESRFTLAFFHILVPYPGTPLYARLRREGRLLYDGRWWLHPDFRYNRATFLPLHMTPEDLGRMTVWANREFYSARSMLLRLMDTKTNLGSLVKFLIYARFNLLVRRTST